jgi:purine nucleosidase
MQHQLDKRTIIVDTDPGQDDAIALLFALAAADRLEVRAITVVAGNVPVDRAARNALVVRDWADRPEIPVYAGCPRPLVRDLTTAESVHGKSGLDGVHLHEPHAGLAAGHAVDFLINALRNSPEGSITLCLIGPSTNFAAALIQAPDVARRIREIVMMGGCYFTRGNVTPVAEFNVYVDPHAANLVFQSGIPLTVLPLDVTHKALTTPVRIEKFRQLGNRCGRAIAQILTSYGRHDIENFGVEGGPLHDPCVIGYLLDPSLFLGRRVNVVVETQSELTLGETVVDWNGLTKRVLNAFWINDIDADGFYSLLTKTVARLP